MDISKYISFFIVYTNIYIYIYVKNLFKINTIPYYNYIINICMNKNI